MDIAIAVQYLQHPMGTDVGLVLTTAPVPPRRAAAVARTMFQRVSSLAMLCAPCEPDLTVLAFATKPRPGKLPVDCDLGALAQRISIDGECRAAALFCADHYTMGGYRVFSMGRLEVERIYWDEPEAALGADVGPDTLVREGLERLTSMPDRRSVLDLITSTPDAWLVLREDARDVNPLRGPVAWDDLDMDFCWAVSFDATHGMRHMLRNGALAHDLLRGLSDGLRK